MTIAKNQKGLAHKALLQPNTAIDNLFRYIAKEEWLLVATENVLTNEGANTAGIDGITKKDYKRVAEVEALRNELKDGMYQPSPVKRVYIPKANGGQRPLGIPNIRDRVVQEAVRMVLEPIMESKFLNCSTGFRPGRRTMDAIHLHSRFANNNIKMWWTVEGDIKGCFDNIPHAKLMGVIKQHICCRKTLNLIERMLSAGIHEDDRTILTNRGVPQGGVCSPLLANIYLHELDLFWWNKYGNLTESQKTHRRQKGLGNVQFIRYAGDFIIMTNGNKSFAYDLKSEFKEFLDERLGLELSEEKSLVTHLADGFDFLGFHIQRKYSQSSNKMITVNRPSTSNIKRLKGKIREMTSREKAGDDPANKILALNRIVKGWTTYYRHVHSSEIFKHLDSFVHMRFYYWLKYKHSNVSAKGSVGKYVIQNYLGRNPKTQWVCFHAGYGVWLYTASQTKIRRYRIKWDENPYLKEESKTFYENDPLDGHIWTGSSQNTWTTVKYTRLHQVGYRCEQCGTKDNLDGHHVIRRIDGGRNTVDNIRILCKGCHVKEHKRDK